MIRPNETTLMLVEDEFLIAQSLEWLLQDAGYCVLGPMSSVEEALEAVAEQRPAADLALLDVNLAGHRVYPVADALVSRNIPFIFLTGCDVKDLPPRFADIPFLIKPFSAEKMFHAIGRVLGGSRGGASPSQLHCAGSCAC